MRSIQYGLDVKRKKWSKKSGKPREEKPEEPIILLEREKERIQRSITTLRGRLDEVESRIDELKSKG